MARRVVTVAHTVEVARPPAEVFDFTQDYAHRAEWDTAFTSAQVISDEPRRIRAEVSGVGRFDLEYKLYRRPERTTAAFVDMASPWFSGGGGSWTYEPAAGGAATRWTQTNSVELKHARLGALLEPFVQRALRRSMERAMARATQLMEARPAAAAS